MNIEVFQSPVIASKRIASEIREIIEERATAGGTAVLGLATGKSPLFLYRELVRMHREEGLSFKNVITFNLDEYFGLSRQHPQSYWRFMHDHLFNYIDILPENIHIPKGDIPQWEIGSSCIAYEKAISQAGGIDFQILGIGRTGHIGFNEPGAGQDSRTMFVHLDAVTRKDAESDFGGIGNVPVYAITMGCGTILKARKIALMAWGAGKAEVVAEAFQRPVSDDIPASYLQEHPAVKVYLDKAAAVNLDLQSKAMGKECFSRA